MDDEGGAIVTLTPKQKRLLGALQNLQAQRNAKRRCSVAEIAEEFDVPVSTLYKKAHLQATEREILSSSSGRGRRQRLNVEEEKLIVEAALEFQRNGTPLDMNCICELTKTLVESFTPERQKSIGFKGNKPGKDWLRYFMRRNSTLTLRKRVNLEAERAEAVTPENLATHFARIKALMDKHDITEADQVLNLDESGFSMRGMSFGRSKCLVQQGTRANTRELKWRGTCDHVTVMPVISAAGQVFTPLFVLPGAEARWRKRGNGTYETPSDFLPKPNYVFMRPIAGVDTNIFYNWAVNFVQESSFLRRDGRKLLLIMDGYACHVAYRTLKMLGDNDIIVAGLPAHTSHVLQPLDVGVFGPLKEAFRQLLSHRTVTSGVDSRHDIFTVCEMLQKAFHTSVNASNAIAGFRRTGLWSASTRSVDPLTIREEDFTSSAVSDDFTARLSDTTGTRSVTSLIRSVASNHNADRIQTYKQLYDLFLKRSEDLCSDGTIVANGTIQVSTRTGATLTSENVINALRERDERNAARAEQRQQAQRQRDQRAVERSAQQEEAQRRRVQRERQVAEREEAQLIPLRDRRNALRSQLNLSRRERRARAASRVRELMNN